MSLTEFQKQVADKNIRYPDAVSASEKVVSASGKGVFASAKGFFLIIAYAAVLVAFAFLPDIKELIEVIR